MFISAPCSIPHRVLHERLYLSKSTLFSGLVFIYSEHVLELTHSPSSRFKAVIMSQRVPISRDVRQLIEHAVLRTHLLAVLLPVLHVRLEHTPMHDNPMALHRRYQRVNNPPFLLAGTVLPDY